MRFFQESSIQEIIITAIAALIAIMGHEVSHGFAAYLLGDPTAKQMGRVTFNPLKHIDPIGLLMLIVAGFGWAKPVPIDMRHFKNPKRGMAVTAFAGPAANFVMAWLGCLCWHLLVFIPSAPAQNLATVFLGVFISRNIGLGVFNLFPVPPLDGSKILGAFLPDKWYYYQLKYERYGMMVLMVLLLAGVFDKPLIYLRTLVRDGIAWLAFL